MITSHLARGPTNHCQEDSTGSLIIWHAAGKDSADRLFEDERQINVAYVAVFH